MQGGRSPTGVTPYLTYPTVQFCQATSVELLWPELLQHDVLGLLANAAEADESHSDAQRR